MPAYTDLLVNNILAGQHGVLLKEMDEDLVAAKDKLPQFGRLYCYNGNLMFLDQNGVKHDVLGDGATGITASTTKTQGQQALTKMVNVVATCANTNDVVTLPAAAAGLVCVIANRGANTLQVFPASGDTISGGTVNASVTQATGTKSVYIAVDATDWVRIISA